MASHTDRLDRALSDRPSPLVRLPDTTRVGGVRLQVSDLPRSLAYYRDVVGLRVIDVAPDVATLGVPASDAALITLNAVPGTRPVPRRGTFGLFHFAILLPDRAALGRFVAHLASIGVPAGMSDHKVSEAIYLTDPDGLGIEVYADRPRSTWRYMDGQLVMTTDPLDVDDLVSAGAGGTWDGAPTGTTIGHVHLHVGDLAQAAAFYHEVVGFDITVSNYPGALFFAAGGYHHHLGTNIWAPGPAAAVDQARLLEWTLVVPSAAEARVVGERLLTAGHCAAVHGHDWTVADPWGTPLRIVSAT
jgi:catechol 2,3-dioxygenase